MRLVLIALFSILAATSVQTSAFAEQRSREKCRAMAEAKGLIGATRVDLERRNKYISNCMQGNLTRDQKKDRK